MWRVHYETCCSFTEKSERQYSGYKKLIETKIGMFSIINRPIVSQIALHSLRPGAFDFLFTGAIQPYCHCQCKDICWNQLDPLNDSLRQRSAAPHCNKNSKITLVEHEYVVPKRYFQYRLPGKWPDYHINQWPRMQFRTLFYFRSLSLYIYIYIYIQS